MSETGDCLEAWSENIVLEELSLFWVVALVRRVTVSSTSNEHNALIFNSQGVSIFQSNIRLQQPCYNTADQIFNTNLWKPKTSQHYSCNVQ
jgi:hypothetical protein